MSTESMKNNSVTLEWEVGWWLKRYEDFGVKIKQMYAIITKENGNINADMLPQLEESIHTDLCVAL